MIDKTIPEHLVFGLDIGTRSIVGTVGYKERNKFTVVAQVTRMHTTRAMLDGQIHDISKVAEGIVAVKKELEEMVGRELTDVCIAAAGRMLKTLTVHVDQELSEECVVNEEQIHGLELLAVEKAYQDLREETHTEKLDFYCVGYTVITYFLNGYAITNLQGHKAKKIGTDLIATFMPNEVVDGLYAAVEEAGLFVANLTLEPIAAINVAIPESYRLLNLALVDVGAGTSDISITRDGSIVAYGMMPYAGDEITEEIVRRYLVDFNTAEQIKLDCEKKKKISYNDIMGINHKITPEEVIEAVADTVKMITENTAEKIKEINGGKSVSAVFVVGGGGKLPGFTDYLAEYLELPKERVAIRGAEVMQNIEFLQEEIQKDSTLVTPVGICLNFYEQSNNFIFVNVNGERVKIYDNGKLSIVDAALQVGLPNEVLFPRRGKAIEFKVNGKQRLIRGDVGEAAVIKLNGEITGMNTSISQNDRIEITPSTIGKDASYEISMLPEYKASIDFIFNGKKVRCPKYVMVNDEFVSGYYEIKDQDEIEFLDYYTLKQVLEFMDVSVEGRLTINNRPAKLNERVYANFEVGCQLVEEDSNVSFADFAHSKEEEPEASIPELVDVPEIFDETPDMEVSDRNIPDEHRDEDVPEETAEVRLSPRAKIRSIIKDDDTISKVEEVRERAPARDLLLYVNDTQITLKNKSEYILVDILDYYDFDVSKAQGASLVIQVNGVDADFTTPVNENDKVSLYWK